MCESEVHGLLIGSCCRCSSLRDEPCRSGDEFEKLEWCELMVVAFAQDWARPSIDVLNQMIVVQEPGHRPLRAMSAYDGSHLEPVKMRQVELHAAAQKKL